MTSSVVGLLVAGGGAVASRVAVSHVCCSYHDKLRSLLGVCGRGSGTAVPCASQRGRGCGTTREEEQDASVALPPASLH